MLSGSESYIWLSETPWTIQSMEFSRPGILQWAAFPFSQGIFPTQGLNPGLPHCRQILYQLSYKGNPKILEWVAYLFSIELLNPGFKPGSPALQGNSLPTELLGKPYGEPLTKEWYDFFCNFNWLIKLLYAVQTGMEQEWDRDNCEEAMRPG